MCSLETACDVAVIDEIQMIGDSGRGHAWTSAVLGLPAKELHLCGEASVEPLIRKMAEACGDVVHVHKYERLTPLVIERSSLKGDLSQIQKGDCIVTFSRSKIFDLKSEIEAKTKLRCAVAYGGLPPETRSEQAKLFNDPDSGFDVMVASDAIGMGLNLKIKRVIFETLAKWNGTEFVWLSCSQIKQIAGRAGRYGTSSDPSETGGSATTLHVDDLEVLQQAIDAPIVPVDQAAIQPTSEALLRLSQLSKASANPDTQASESGTDAIRQQGVAGSRPLAALYNDVAVLSKVDSSTYFLADFEGQLTISPIVERASAIFTSTSKSDNKQKSDSDGKDQSEVEGEGASSATCADKAASTGARSTSGTGTSDGRDGGLLTMVERETFANAPVSTRDDRVMEMMENLVRLYVLGELVRFEKAAQHLGMLETLDEIDVMHTKAEEARERAIAEQSAALSPSEDASEDGEVKTKLDSEAASKRPPAAKAQDLSAAHFVFTSSDPPAAPGQPAAMSEGAKRLVHVDTLMTLESLHRCISLYLWLSFRFPLAFCYRPQVLEIKGRTEKAIVFILDAMRLARATRLAALAT
ncbi:hypothetical protein K437DRAFT_290460, partial [Tilletiaria anomala UBC 951]